MGRIVNRGELDNLRESLRKKEDPKAVCITVCGGTGCSALGSQSVGDAFTAELEKRGLKEKVLVRNTGCHGFCEQGPVVVILPSEIFYPQVTPEDVPEIVTKTVINNEVIDRLLYVDPGSGRKIIYDHEVPFYEKQKRIVLRDNGRLDPTDIYDYIARDGYQALSKALTSMTPEQVIDEVEKSGLRGRGGAGFPTGRKWRLARAAKGDLKYVVCNGDEGDPGAFMDRSVMEGNPHLVLEGMAIAAFAIGASVGYVYVRAEYPLAVANLRLAIARAEEMGFLGNDILGSGFSLEIRIKEGAGAFVCGEETALMASIEGKIGRPRPRPPFPAQVGLWGRPTNINNVETLATIPHIINNRSGWYAGLGTETSKGTKIFSLTGKVNNTGLVEVPMGSSLGELVYDIGGGIPRGRKFKAAQTGGPSGGCIPAEYLGLPIDYESLAAIGSIIGSGGLVVMDESTCMVDIARFFLSFTQSESCGKCTPCRLGTKRMLEILTRITQGEGTENDIDLLLELAQIVKDSSLCGLGQTAPNPVLSTIKYFRDEYDAHIREKRCPAAVCEALVYAPCEHTCPVNVDAVGYVALIGQGRFEEALDMVRQSNPLAGICGRVCHHPCEGRCRRGDLDQPVAIASLKRAAADYGVTAGRQTRVPVAKRREERVAVIGSGPAGLNAAYHLARKGYQTTIFEALPLAGGMLAVGIPDYRLPREVLQADIDFITGLGVEIKLNTPIGDKLSIDGLLQQGYKAVLLAIGAHQGLRLGIDGDEAEGVFDGVSFLRNINLKNKVVPGEKVAVIGGGNVALDAARSSLRLGAREVTIVYRRAKEDMPANEEEIYEAEHEGINIRCMTAPLRITAKDGHVESLVCQRTEPGEYDASGRRRPEPIPGSEFSLKIDTVIAAIGQAPDTPFLKGDDGLVTAKGGTIVADTITLATGRAGVFAAGDGVTGPATVVEALASGERAAISIDRYLRGADLKENRYLEKKTPIDIPWDEENLESGGRREMPALAVSERTRGFAEVNLGYSKETAIKEARRCLRCDLRR
ncbi:MAG: NADH-ubiquinone oxidoreductase-F iron-sulfur binding region domain-containing protein [Dehalococcoidales bacterium]|jgi:NADH-quinone oxidoreductase subunit F